MLSLACLDDYLVAYRLAQKQAPEAHHSTPAEFLTRPNGRLSGNDLMRLARTLDISAHLDEAPVDAAQCADIIGRHVKEARCAEFSDSETWIKAIQWASTELNSIPPDERRRPIMTRQLYVAEACKRLRAERHAIPLCSDGPNISRETCIAIGRGLDSLVKLLGGETILKRVFANLRQNSRYYDGFWLFGDQVPTVYGHKTPSMPWGYLISLGLKHIGVRGSARKPDVAWNSLIKKTTDLATLLDCERYNQFDGMFLSDADFFPIIAESLSWREIFTLPQVPPVVITTLQEAFSSVLTPEDRALHPINFDNLFSECESLILHCSVDAPTVFPPDYARRAFPTLVDMATGKRGRVNANYVAPIGATSRDQDSVIFFERFDSNLVALNRTLTASAICEVIFRAVWDGNFPSKRAKDIVGTVLERSIAIGCRGKTAEIAEHTNYNVAKVTFDVDVATRDQNEIVFFETKAKSLTAEARSFDIGKFLTDYADSYLELLKQLARHEKHAIAGLTPLIKPADDTTTIRFTKVAVSPLSYGPAADKPLAAQLIQSMANCTLRVDGGNDMLSAAVAKYNSAKQAAVTRVAEIAPKNREGLINLNAYLIHVYWLDLGQLLYSLSRAQTVIDALSPLRHCTFATRDFWTELAFADIGGHLEGKWRSVSPQR